MNKGPTKYTFSIIDRVFNVSPQWTMECIIA